MQFYRIQYYKKNAHQTTSYVADGSCSFPLGGGSSGTQQHRAAASEAAAGEELAPSVSLLSRDKKQVQWSRKAPASVELMERRNVIGFLKGRQRGDG